MIYFDNAATTLRKPDCVIQAVVQAMQSFGNSGRGIHSGALSASRIIYDARAAQVAKYFDAVGVRATVDARNEKIGRKVRDNELKRIPYMLIVGEKEQADGTVAVRPQGGGEQCVMTMEDFAKKINDECREMTKEF